MPTKMTFNDIIYIVKPLADKYNIREVYLFGSYARNEATEDSDLDFLVYGGDEFKSTMIFAFAEELRKSLEKNVDVFEIHEINKDSEFYNTIMKERVLVAGNEDLADEMEFKSLKGICGEPLDIDEIRKERLGL